VEIPDFSLNMDFFSVFCSTLMGDTRARKNQQKTGVCRKTVNPIWNQTLLFDNISCEGIELSLWHYDLLATHTCLGSIRLDSDHYLWTSMVNRHSFWVEAQLPFGIIHSNSPDK